MQTVLFVCPHGAGMSRIAAAYFNLLAPDGWQATSAGLEPQSELGTNAPRLLAGTPAEAHLDRAPPRAIDAAPSPIRTVGIRCDVAGAERWELEHREFTDAMRDEIHSRVAALVAVCAGQNQLSTSS
jgi:hypothetical protein